MGRGPETARCAGIERDAGVNYRDNVSCDTYRYEVVKSWEFDPEEYTSSSKRPWDAGKLSVLSVYFAPEFTEAGIESTAYYFHGFLNLLSAWGFEALSEVGKMNQMFVSCRALTAVHSNTESFSVTSGSLMFSGCNRLVGGTRYVAGQMDDHRKLNYVGLLTDPSYDLRRYCNCFLYGDGELVIRRSQFPDQERELIAHGLVLCECTVQGRGRPSLARFRGERQADHVRRGHVALHGSLH